MRHKPHKPTFGEQYEIKYNLQKADGYWLYGQIETVSVAVHHGVNEKNNHRKAEAIFLKNHPKAKVVSVTYC